MVDFAKNTNYLNQQTRSFWANIRIGDIKDITKSVKKKKVLTYDKFEAEIVSKTSANIIYKRLDNNKFGSFMFSDLLQNEIEVIRKKDYPRDSLKSNV